MRLFLLLSTAICLDRDLSIFAPSCFGTLSSLSLGVCKAEAYLGCFVAGGRAMGAACQGCCWHLAAPSHHGDQEVMCPLLLARRTKLSGPVKFWLIGPLVSYGVQFSPLEEEEKVLVLLCHR